MINDQRLMESVPDSEILLYTSPDGQVQLDVRLQEDTLWMTQQMMAELFQTTVANINVHIKNILQEAELQEEGTIKEILIVRKEGSRNVRRPVNFYNLDMILSVGYRVNTRRGTQFRIWATQRLREYLVRGYVVHEKRLQQQEATA